MNGSIEQVESDIAQELEVPLKAALKRHGYSIHDNLRLRLSLLGSRGRKKRSSAAAHSWAPEKSEAGQFWLEPADPEASTSSSDNNTNQSKMEVSLVGQQPNPSHFPNGMGQNAYIHPAEAELLRALDRAESTPGWTFVALKKFRDEILRPEDIPSIRSAVERQSVLRSAIDKRLILTKPVFNPKSPQFPVASIRVNRLLPEVQAILGKAKADLEFRPIHIKGEPLSATILRERR